MEYSSSFSRMLRAAFRNKGLTLINVVGLSVGLSVTMFLLVYLNFEFSYDKHFKDADRIYRVLSVWQEGEKVVNHPICFLDLGSTLIRDVPEVETTARIYAYGGGIMQYENGEKMNVKGYQADSIFLDVFSFPVVYGKLEHALDVPGKCVLTRATAERFFGLGVNPVGKSLTDGKDLFEVMAVIENIPANTHMQFEMLTKLPDFGNEGLEYYTYVKFRPGTDYKVAAEKCNAVNKGLLDTRFSSMGAKFGSITEPLLSIHTATKASYDLTPASSKSNLIFIILVAIFVLAIAICNFVSLYVIQGEKRATEICVRKTNGADRNSVVKMLFGETFFITLLSFVLAVVFYFSFSGLFGRLINFNLPDNVGLGWLLWGNFILLFFVVAVIAGGYPAYYLSRFSPSELIRKTVARKYKLTAASVVIQFSVVIFCISALFVVMRQLDYVKNLPLGFDPSNVLTVSVSVRTEEVDGLRADLMQYPEIKAVAVSYGHLLDECSGHGLCPQGANQKSNIIVDEQRVGSGYMDLYKIKILQGRNFSENQKADRLSMILSESTVKALGLTDPIGQKVLINDDVSFTVIGVAQDIHYTSAHEKMGNLVYSAYLRVFSMLSVSFEPGSYQEAKDHLLSVLSKRYQGIPVAVVLMTDLVKDQYVQDDVTFRILMSGTVLAIILALLGLLALTGFVAQQKRKEISLRRVLGAQVSGIVIGLNRYILARILPAVPIGITLSYYAMTRWLQNFEYAISLTWWIFALALLLTFFVVLLTIMYQSLKSAMANPVDALKSE